MMTAKEWLNRARNINLEIEAMEQAKEKLFAHYTRVTPYYADAPDGGSPDPHKLDGYAAFSEQLDRRIRNLTDVCAEIFGVICRVPDSRLRTLLIYRYLNFMTWKEIAEATNYSYRAVTYQHGEALRAVEDFLVLPIDSE